MFSSISHPNLTLWLLPSTLALHPPSHSMPLFQATPFCVFTFCQPDQGWLRYRVKRYTPHPFYFSLSFLVFSASSLFSFSFLLLPNLDLFGLLNTIGTLFSMFFFFFSFYLPSLNVLNAYQGVSFILLAYLSSPFIIKFNNRVMYVVDFFHYDKFFLIFPFVRDENLSHQAILFERP